MRTLVVGSIQHNIQEMLNKTRKRITYKADLSDNLTLYFHSNSCFRISFSYFPEKISRHFLEKALPPYRFEPQDVIRDDSSG